MTDLPVVLRRRESPLPKQADPNAPLLVVEGLKTHFSLESGTVSAVDGISFTLEYGEALGIAGESGCGKTTTALSLVRILPSNATIVEGSVKLMGIDLVPKSENAMRRYRWREISIVFQGAMNALNPVRRVRDQIAEPIEQRLGASPATARKRAGELLDVLNATFENVFEQPVTPLRAGRREPPAAGPLVELLVTASAGGPTRTSCRAGCASAR